MDHAACPVIYYDRRANNEVFIDRENALSDKDGEHGLLTQLSDSVEVRENLARLLGTFYGIHICHSGIASMNKIRELEIGPKAHLPLLVIIDVDASVDLWNQNRLSRESSLLPPDSSIDVTIGELHGLQLLKHIAAENLRESPLHPMICLALVRNRDSATPTRSSVEVDMESPDFLRPGRPGRQNQDALDAQTLIKCLNAGAADAVPAPLSSMSLRHTLVHVYKAHLHSLKDRPERVDLKRLRKRSWVGVEDERPYAYLRESMVASLMGSICRPENLISDFTGEGGTYQIHPERETKIMSAIGTWNFSAHDFSDDELVHAAFLMLSHALKSRELAKWRIADDDLKSFLVACRSAYNSFVLYHNFRHVVDVLQALFFSLVQIGLLPSCSDNTTNASSTKPLAPIAKHLVPFDALVLLVSAVGHDVGHPGVNNAFLVTLKAPLAQLYNDKSVLEAFHCAAYSQILRRHWKTVFDDESFRRMLINTILATDMGIHPDYMANMGNLQEKLHHDGSTDGWTPKLIQSNKDLILGLLIKCADISNVARPFKIAAKWSQVLQREFARQGEMERDVGIPSVLFGGPPELGNIVKLANSQIGFINFFATPLFEGIVDVLPGMQFALDEIAKNKEVWEKRIKDEQRFEGRQLDMSRSGFDGTQSPRSASPERTIFTISPEGSHPEGLPASGAILGGPVVPVNDMDIGKGRHRVSSLFDGVQESFFTPPASPHRLRSFEGNELTMRPTLVPVTDVTEAIHRGLDSYPLAGGIPWAPGIPDTRHVLSQSTASSRPTSDSQSPSSDETQRPESVLSNGTADLCQSRSTHHSSQPSCTATRSSVPSSTPTFSSEKCPVSPTFTNATSVDTSGSELEPALGSPGLQMDPVFDRPSTGCSSSLAIAMPADHTSALGMSSQSARSSEFMQSDKGLPRTGKMRPVTSGNENYRTSIRRNKDLDAKEIKRKSNKFRFDFWRRRKTAQCHDSWAPSSLPSHA